MSAPSGNAAPCENSTRRASSFRAPTLALVLSVLAILLVAALSIEFGARWVSFEEVWQGLVGAQAGLGSAVVGERVTRTLYGLIAGAALGISGALMQAITRNPIADPSVLGVNTGAALFVVMGIAFLGISTAQEYIVLALLGAALTTVLVYRVASLGRGGATPIKLALAGTATAAALTSLVSAIMLPRGQVMDTFRFWQVGSVGGATAENIALIAPFLVFGVLVGLLSATSLNALALGDDVAAGLGVKTGRVRIVCAAAGVALCGTITALSGPIGFVGLMAPHVVRMLAGPDQRLLIPLSAVVGACVLTLADVIGRLLGSPGELEVGVVTAFIGAPILIVVAIRSKVRAL